MFIAAMEDYQLENADGKVNPTANLDYYLRCSRLIHNVERAVVYGSPVLSANYNMHASRPVSVDGSKLLDASYYEKNNRADEIMQANSKAQAKPRPTSIRRPDPTVNVDVTLLHGVLLYKRVLRKSSISTKTWKSRYFKVEHRILFCYKDDESKVPLRSIVIRDFDLNIVTREKYQFQFELYSKITGVTFKLRADTEATFDFWVQGLRRLDEIYVLISHPHDNFPSPVEMLFCPVEPYQLQYIPVSCNTSPIHDYHDCLTTMCTCSRTENTYMLHTVDQNTHHNMPDDVS